MGSRGPAPTPTAILSRRGSWRAQERSGELAPELYRSPPAPPAWLSGPGRAEWRRVAAELHAMRMLAKVDRAMLAVYCAEVGRYVQAEEHIREHGAVLVVHESGAGGELLPVSATPNPAVAVAQKSAALIRQLAREFGLSPAGRVNLKAPAAEPEKPQGKAALFARHA